MWICRMALLPTKHQVNPALRVPMLWALAHEQLVTRLLLHHSRRHHLRITCPRHADPALAQHDTWHLLSSWKRSSHVPLMVLSSSSAEQDPRFPVLSLPKFLPPSTTVFSLLLGRNNLYIPVILTKLFSTSKLRMHRTVCHREAVFKLLVAPLWISSCNLLEMLPYLLGPLWVSTET